jgi:hypothetical protein
MIEEEKNRSKKRRNNVGGGGIKDVRIGSKEEGNEEGTRRKGDEKMMEEQKIFEMEKKMIR